MRLLHGPCLAANCNTSVASAPWTTAKAGDGMQRDLKRAWAARASNDMDDSIVRRPSGGGGRRSLYVRRAQFDSAGPGSNPARWWKFRDARAPGDLPGSRRPDFERSSPVRPASSRPAPQDRIGRRINQRRHSSWPAAPGHRRADRSQRSDLLGRWTARGGSRTSSRPCRTPRTPAPFPRPTPGLRPRHHD